jgi:hypothetical protein
LVVLTRTRRQESTKYLKETVRERGPRYWRGTTGREGVFTAAVGERRDRSLKRCTFLSAHAQPWLRRIIAEIPVVHNDPMELKETKHHRIERLAKEAQVRGPYSYIRWVCGRASLHACGARARATFPHGVSSSYTPPLLLLLPVSVSLFCYRRTMKAR